MLVCNIFPRALRHGLGCCRCKGIVLGNSICQRTDDFNGCGEGHQRHAARQQAAQPRLIGKENRKPRRTGLKRSMRTDLCDRGKDEEIVFPEQFHSLLTLHGFKKRHALIEKKLRCKLSEAFLHGAVADERQPHPGHLRNGTKKEGQILEPYKTSEEEEPERLMFPVEMGAPLGESIFKNIMRKKIFVHSFVNLLLKARGKDNVVELLQKTLHDAAEPRPGCIPRLQSQLPPSARIPFPAKVSAQTEDALRSFDAREEERHSAAHRGERIDDIGIRRMRPERPGILPPAEERYPLRNAEYRPGTVGANAISSPVGYNYRLRTPPRQLFRKGTHIGCRATDVRRIDACGKYYLHNLMRKNESKIPARPPNLDTELAEVESEGGWREQLSCEKMNSRRILAPFPLPAQKFGCFGVAGMFWKLHKIILYVII